VAPRTTLVHATDDDGSADVTYTYNQFCLTSPSFVDQRNDSAHN